MQISATWQCTDSLYAKKEMTLVKMATVTGYAGKRKEMVVTGQEKKTAGCRANGSQRTLNCFQQEKYQELKSGLSDFLARISPSQGNGLDLPENEVDYFLQLLVCSKAQRPKISPESLSLRMLSIFCQAAAEGILPPFSLTYGKLGMTQNGSVSIQRISEYPRTGKECTLLDILEEGVDEKYFLSAEQTERMLKKL